MIYSMCARELFYNLIYKAKTKPSLFQPQTKSTAASEQIYECIFLF